MAELIEGKKYKILSTAPGDPYNCEDEVGVYCGDTAWGKQFKFGGFLLKTLDSGFKYEEYIEPPREAEFATMEFDETDHLLSTEANRERLKEVISISPSDLKDIIDYKSPGHRQFESGAVRDKNEGKPFVHSLQGYTRLRFGYHMSKNAKKYGANNFLLGIPTEVYLESLDRHLAQYISGDRSEDHLSAILFGVQGVMLNEEKEGVRANKYYES